MSGKQKVVFYCQCYSSRKLKHEGAYYCKFCGLSIQERTKKSETSYIIGYRDRFDKVPGNQSTIEGFSGKPNPSLAEDSAQLKAKNEDLARRLDVLNGDLTSITKNRDSLAEENERLRAEKNTHIEDTKRLENELKDVSSDRDALAEDKKHLEEDALTLKEKIKELSGRVGELEAAQSQSDTRVHDLADKNRGLMKKVDDLEENNRHLLNVNRSLEAIDAHGIVEHFLEFSTGMYNAVLDNDDIEKVRELADARLDQLSNSVSSRGMELRFHRRGETLTEGRVDHIDVPTDDPDLDMTVKRSKGFGFSFGSDAVSDIVEGVCVYVYDERKRPEDARAASTGETRIRVFEEPAPADEAPACGDGEEHIPAEETPVEQETGAAAPDNPEGGEQ